MLISLEIENIILIEKSKVDFTKGLHILSGETGAGKTAILQALQLILGSRFDPTLIRKGEKQGSVLAHFSFDQKHPIYEKLAKLELDVDPSEDLFIQRQLKATGKSKLIINHQPCSLFALKEISKTLIQMVSQHAATELMLPSSHQKILDSFAHNNDALTELSQSHQTIQELKKELLLLDQQQTQKQQLHIQWQEQLEEIQAAQIKSATEEEELFSEYQNLSHAKERLMDLSLISEELYESEHSLFNRFQKNLHLIRKWSPNSSQLRESENALSTLLEELKEHSLMIIDERDQVEESPSRLCFLEDRLSLINQLKKKHGASLEEILCKAKELENKLDPSQSYQEKKESLLQTLHEKETLYAKQAQIITQNCTRAKDKLEQQIGKLFTQLQLPQAALIIKLDPVEPSATGLEQVEFLLQANPGEHPSPLKKRASGGELSRVLLALKVLSMKNSATSTWFFDEIDTNLGGETASKVGQLLKAMSSGRQIIAITHLPQVATCANHHYLIEKHLKNNRTYSNISLLNEKQRVEELKRMLGGQSMSKKTQELAEDLISSTHSQT